MGAVDLVQVASANDRQQRIDMGCGGGLALRTAEGS
jgi:hypothetical protein